MSLNFTYTETGPDKYAESKRDYNERNSERHAATRNQAINRRRRENPKLLRSDNTSGFKGITWDKEKLMWKVRITIDGQRKALGYFHKIEDAISSYNEVTGKVS